MAAANEIREFLTTRRARITAGQAGLQAFGSRRRVAGLRREEVAMLAGISAEYYTQLERGSVRGVSEDVLEAILTSRSFRQCGGAIGIHGLVVWSRIGGFVDGNDHTAFPVPAI